MSAAAIAKKLGVDPRKARVALRAAGIRAPYDDKDRAKITAIIRKLKD
jgi:predicted glycosyltransferase